MKKTLLILSGAAAVTAAVVAAKDERVQTYAKDKAHKAKESLHDYKAVLSEKKHELKEGLKKKKDVLISCDKERKCKQCICSCKCCDCCNRCNHYCKTK